METMRKAEAVYKSKVVGRNLESQSPQSTETVALMACSPKDRPLAGLWSPTPERDRTRHVLVPGMTG